MSPCIYAFASFLLLAAVNSEVLWTLFFLAEHQRTFEYWSLAGVPLFLSLYLFLFKHDAKVYKNYLCYFDITFH